MALFDKGGGGKRKRDVVELLGGDPAPSYDERLERSSRRMRDRLEGMGGDRRNRLYIRLTCAICALFVAAVAAGALYTCSQAGASRLTAQSAASSRAPQAASSDDGSQEAAQAGEGAEDVRLRFNGLIKLTWLADDDVDALCAQLLEWADAAGFPDGYSVCILTMSDSASTGRFYAEVLPQATYVSCERSGGRWAFAELDGRPADLAADQEKTVASAQRTRTNDISVPVSDAAGASKYIPDGAAEGLAEALSGYCSAKGWGFDAESSRLKAGTVKTTSNQSTFGVEASGGGQTRYLTVTYDISKKTYSFAEQH